MACLRACNSRIVYMLYDDEQFMLKSNKTVLVTDGISLLNFEELINGGFVFCHTTNSGATTNTGTSIILC